jgi:O-antigen ligase
MEIFEKNWDLIRSDSTITASPNSSLSLAASLRGRRLVLAVCGSLLIFAPLAYGAVHPWAYFTVALTVSALSLVLLTFGLFKIWAGPKENRFLPYPPLWWLAVGLGMLVFLQVVPWPQGVIRWLSPAAWETRALGNGFGLAPYVPLSLNPYATLLETLKLGPALILFFIFIYTINSRRQIKILVGLILAVAFFEVLYGLWHFRSHLIWGWPNPYAGTRLCGTFINSNHLAAYLSMAILLGFGLFLDQVETTRHSSRDAAESSESGSIRRLSRPEHTEPKFRGLFLLFFLLLLTVGLIFTGSRGGMISLALGFALMAGLIWGKEWKRGHLILILVVLGAALLYSLFLGSAPYLAHFQDLTDRERYQAMLGGMRVFKAYPWTGSGIATFGEIFYRYEPAEFNGQYFLYTHNDLLQLLAETGVGGVLLLAVAGGAFYSTLVGKWRQRRESFSRNLGIGGIAALGAVIFHALVEFPFHIPAVSLTFAAVAALTYLTLFSQLRGNFDFFSYPTIRFPGPGRRALWVLLGLIAVQGIFAFQVGRCWLAEHLAPMEMNSTCLAPKLAGEDFRRALKVNAYNSKYYLGLAETLEKQGAGGGASPEEVEKSLQAAIFHAPSHWDYHQKLAEFYLSHYSEAPRRYLPLALKEFAASVTLFPESGGLNLCLAIVSAWAERYFPELVPMELRGREEYYAQQAVRLQPDLAKFWPNR